MSEFCLPEGLRIGHAGDTALKSGVTVILPDKPAIAGVHVAGGAPGTRETDLLRPEATVDCVDAIVLAGGSAFGLAAGDGAAAWLAGQGRGFRVHTARVPIVPAAIFFDLLNGGDKRAIPGSGEPDDTGKDPKPSPYFLLGWQACAAAAPSTPLGSVGCGIGATTADLKGGFGAAETTLAGGGRLAAFVAVNAFGSATFGDGPHFRAAVFEADGEYGGLGLPRQLPDESAAPRTKQPTAPRQNTTIAVVATDLALTKAQAGRLAIAAHDGIAHAIFPAHTPLDGDTVFALSTGALPLGDEPLQSLVDLGSAAATTLARAIARAVYEAEPAENDVVPTWRKRFAGLAGLPAG